MNNTKILLVAALLIMPFFLLAQVSNSKVSGLRKKENTAVVPKENKVSEWWQNRHAKKLEEIKGPKSNTQLIFIGNSIINDLESSGNKEIWEKFFGKYNPLNLGFGGDRTENVLWRITHGEIEGLHPKIAVILIGTNNTDAEHYPTTNTGAEVAEGIIAICDVVRLKLSQTKILILKIFPFGEDPNNKRRADNNEASRIASKIADGKNIFYADLNDNFLNPDKTIDTSIMPDYLHPSVAGDWIWAKSLYPIIESIMQL